jgi:ubiquinol-cytochrome c reductase cytochrome b subunit
MSTDAKPGFAATRLGFLSAWVAEATAPKWAREAPYLAIFPGLITGALIFLAASGLVLAVHYNPAHAFASLQFIDRDVANGWLIHGFHETGTSMLFGLAYLLLFRSILGRTYTAPREFVWVLGVAQFVLLLLIGWLGVALTGGAVSYWSVANAAHAAELLGGAPGALGSWFFGGPDGPNTLARLAVLHIALALAVFGLIALRNAAARAVRPPVNPREAVGFHPYYTAQYAVGFAVFALIFAILVFFAPHFGENPLNRAAGGPLLVPLALTPPWYLAPLAAIQSVLPGAAGAILATVAALAVLFALPWLDRGGVKRGAGFWYQLSVYALALDVLGLGLAAAAGPSMVSSILITLFTLWYFLHFLVLTPLITTLEAA